MKRELSAILGLLLSVAIFAQKERNVTLTLSVDSFISSQEQMAYLYGYIGNECNIYDSVKIVPDKQTYRLKGYVPYEGTLTLALSRRGPFSTRFLVHPGEKVQLQLTKEDGEKPGTHYKKLQKGSPANDELVALWTKIYDVANRRFQIKDSMAIIHFVWPLTKDVVILQTGSLNLEFGSMMAQSMLEETLQEVMGNKSLG